MLACSCIKVYFINALYFVLRVFSPARLGLADAAPVDRAKHLGLVEGEHPRSLTCKGKE